MKFFFRTIALLIAIAIAGFGAAFAVEKIRATDIVETVATTDNTQVIHAVNRTEEVVLLSLGIQGIQERTANSKVFGVSVPWSDRATFLQYNFNAKIGINGAGVVATKLTESKYQITIPTFEFLGHDDVTFKMAAENNGALSWVTEDIDEVEMVNNILNDETQSQYVTANLEILRDQAESFYTSIVESVDPNATIAFTYADAPSDPVQQ